MRILHKEEGLTILEKPEQSRSTRNKKKIKATNRTTSNFLKELNENNNSFVATRISIREKELLNHENNHTKDKDNNTNSSETDDESENDENDVKKTQQTPTQHNKDYEHMISEWYDGWSHPHGIFKIIHEKDTSSTNNTMLIQKNSKRKKIHSITLENCNLGYNENHSNYRDLPDFLFSSIRKEKSIIKPKRKVTLGDKNNLEYTLCKLSLSRNNLHYFFNIHYIGSLFENLTELDLSDNLAEELPATLHQLKNLKYLDISGNKLSHLLIPTYKSSLIDKFKAHEKILQWQRKEASKLPNRNKDYIGELTNLTCMKINGNKLSELPSSMIRGMRSLSILEIRGNNLTSLPPFFGNYYHNLRILKLDRNQISEFPKDDDNVCLMRKCQRLEEINLANNLFTEIPSFLLTEMKYLQILNMTSNLLQTLPPKFGFVGKSLKHLYLHNNPLKQLENDYGYRVVGNSDGTTTNEEDIVCVSVENPQYTLWRCRQKYWIENKHHGQRPPDMKISVCGIQNECLLIQPEHRERIQRKIKDCFLSSSSSDRSSRTERKRRIRLGRNNDQIIQNSLVLTQLNLGTIPPELIDFMEKNEMEVDDKSSKQQQERYRIHHLDLSRNNFSQSLNNDDDKKPTSESFEFPPCFSILLSLSMKSCKINALSPTIQNMGSNRNSQRSGRLTCLNLNDNFLTNLPKEITRLRKLQNLILSNNKLTGVPNLKELSNLTELILDANKLSNVPEGISSLRSLEKLSISRNHLTFIDLSILELKRLKYLNLMQNFIERLPLNGLNGMKSLSHLRLSGNKIKFLEDDCFSLWYSAKEKGSIWIDSNNLSDLPCGFEKINTNFIDLKFDKNPLQSPPIQEILLSSSSLSSHTQQERKQDDETEGETPIDTVMKYCENRSFRLNKMKKLLEFKGNFEINHENFRPKAKDIFVLSSLDDDDETSGSKNSLSKTNLSIGYLQEKDLENFDKEVDQYINGKFYLYTTTAEKLVDDLIALRRKRQNQFFYHICQATINFFWNCYHYHQDDSWNGIQYRYDILRPWGKDDELCSCFAFPIEFLNRDKEKNQEEESHSSLYKWILHEISSTDALDSSVVALLNQEIVVNALVTFKAPRMIARVEDINYSSNNLNNNDETLEQHSVELKQKSVVICKMIYTKEESKRRQEEEDLMFDYFKKMEKQIDEYFSPLSPSNKGFLRQLDHEIKTNMIKNKKKLSDKKEEVKLLQRTQMIPAQEELLVAQRRKKDFEDGDKPFLYHRVKSQEEIDSIVKEKQDKLDDAKQRYEILNNQLESIQAVIKSHDRKKTEQERIDTLKKKYCFYIYDKIITYGRVWAHYNNLRRPWDGQDGIEFIQFQQENLYSSQSSIDEEIQNEYELVSKEEFIEHLDKLVKYGIHSTDSSGIGGDIVDTPNFTWDDQEISQDIYDNQFYEKYRSVQSSNDIVSAIKIGVEKTVKKKKEGMIFHNLNFKKRFQLGGNKK